MSGRIRPLPSHTIAQIRSSKHITSLQGVVLSLLENCLDAGATKVEVGVHFRRGGCVVEDNAPGIPAVEFAGDGGLGRMYCSSKLPGDPFMSHELHGNTGTFLASVAALSLLAITSQYIGEEEISTLTIHHGQVISRQSLASASNGLTVSSQHGTKVSVRDLFGKMPVRVKQRALSYGDARGRVREERAWRELKSGVVALLLAWPKPCAVRIFGEDESTSARIINLSPTHPTVSNSLTEKGLEKLSSIDSNWPKFDVADMLAIMFQAALAPVESRSNWIPVSASTSSISVKGLICLDPAPTAQCQFLSIGVNPCSLSKGYNELYDAVNKIFGSSGFGCVQSGSSGGPNKALNDGGTHRERHRNVTYTKEQFRVSKGVDRWPMFVLKIEFRENHGHLSVAQHIPFTSLRAIVDILEATAFQWLEVNHFRPCRFGRAENQHLQGPPSASRALGSSSDQRPNSLPRFSKSYVRPESERMCKKRKLVDLAGSIQGPNGYQPIVASMDFSNWTRTKSGRAVTAPAGQSNIGVDALQRSKQTAFSLPAVEAGALSTCAKRRSDHSSEETPVYSTAGDCWESAAFSPLNETAERNCSLLDCVSGEYSGSIVDEEVFANVLANGHENRATSSREVMEGTLQTDGLLNWADPVTREPFIVNARTGIAVPLRPKVARREEDGDAITLRQPAAINTSFSSARKPLTLSRRQSDTTSTEKKQSWLPEFLKQWDNPVFAKQQREKIPVVIDGCSHDIAGAMAKHCSHESRTACLTAGGSVNSAGGSSKLSKTALRRARVVAQVDRKFILCKMPSTFPSVSGSKIKPDETEDREEILVLIDQHATSERVILESLLDELCASHKQPDDTMLRMKSEQDCSSAINTSTLERPIRYQILESDHSRFAEKSNAQHLAQWGILYRLFDHKETALAGQSQAMRKTYFIEVFALPPVIKERCCMTPNLLIDLIRTEVWNAAKHPYHFSSQNRLNMDAGHRHNHDVETQNDDGHHTWLVRIGSCPRGILELLSSRACRSAIMFNDALTLTECEELVANVSGCAFPFACAHGRVSMVPVVSLGGSVGSEECDLATTSSWFLGSEDKAQEDESFTGVLKRWMVLKEAGAIDIC